MSFTEEATWLSPLRLVGKQIFSLGDTSLLHPGFVVELLLRAIKFACICLALTHVTRLDLPLTALPPASSSGHAVTQCCKCGVP